MLPPFSPEALDYIKQAHPATALKPVPKIDDPSEELFALWIKTEGCGETVAPRKKIK